MSVSEIPYYKQEKWYTCGPACLRMLLKYTGTSASKEDVAKACGTTELGTTPLQLVKGSKVFGFDADAFKHEDIDDLKYLLKNGNPVIVLLDPGILYGGIQGFGHFIVITGFDNNNITYHDPDILDGQNAKCSIDRFMQAWSALKCWVIKLQKVKQ